MFDLFGDMDSAEEINKTAAGLKDEGDIENLKKLAEENGLPQEMAELYAAGETDWLADPMTAAIGKIEVEEKELKLKEIMNDWAEYLKSQCMENEKLAAAVRKKGKSLRGCMTKLLEWSFKNQFEVDQGIRKAAGLRANVTIGIPGMGRAKTIMKEYYLTEEKSNEEKNV